MFSTVGSGGTILHYDGNVWSSVDSSTTNLQKASGEFSF